MLPLTNQNKPLRYNYFAAKTYFVTILDDFEACGIVGSQIANQLASTLATSRLLERLLGWAFNLNG